MLTMATRNEMNSEGFNGRGPATSSGNHSIRIHANNPFKQATQSNPAIPSDPDHENKLNTFALRLALLEKLGIMVGTLTFIWATVVLLGGFAITMKESDFWVVTAILVIEGARLFSRNHQLELQHQDKNDCSGSLIRRTAQFFNCPGCSSCPDPSSHATASTRQGASHGKETWTTNSGLRQSKMRKWENLRVPILPWLEIRASNVLLLLELVQVLAALATLAMSIARLRMQQFTLPKEKEDGTQINHRSALFIFYSLAITEALVFLIQRLYWEINIYYRHVLERLNKSLGLKLEDLPMTRSFFYQVYSTCLSQSIYGSLKMDMVDYALSWLQSDQADEQLGALSVLVTYAKRMQVDSGGVDNTLRSIGMKQGAVERLLEMVTWNDQQSNLIRQFAADLLRRIVKSNPHSIRVISISGSIERVTRLFISNANKDNIHIRIVALKILKYLIRDPLTRYSIHTVKLLETCLFNYIRDVKNMLRDRKNQDRIILQVKLCLQLLHMLANKDLVKENTDRMSELVQWLLGIFLQGTFDDCATSRRAGKALCLLAQTSDRHALLMETNLQAIMEMISDKRLGHIAMTVLRTLCVYRNLKFRDTIVKECMMQTMKIMMSPKEGDTEGVPTELNVAALGLLWEVARDIEMESLMEEAGIQATDVVKRLKEVVQLEAVTAVEKRMFPYMKRSAVGLAMALTTYYDHIFKPLFAETEIQDAFRKLSASDLLKTEAWAIGDVSDPVVAETDPDSELLDQAAQWLHLCNRLE